jgi:hypothetical protein
MVRKSRFIGKWWKRVKIAARGGFYVLSHPQYLTLALGVALLFAYILTMTTSGTTELKLLFSSLSFGDKVGVLGGIFGRVFTNTWSVSGALVWLLSICQGILISLLIFHRRRSRKLDDSALMNSSIASVLAIVGAGCPTCGTSLIMPLLTVVFSSAAYTVLNSLSAIILVVAFVLVLFSLRRLGFLCYTIESRDKHFSKKETNDGKK